MKTAKDLVQQILAPPKSSEATSNTGSAPEFTAASARKYLKAFRPEDQTLETMLSVTAQFVADLYHDRNPRCLSFLGPSGTGKSMLGRLVAGFFHQFMTHRQDKGLSDGIWRCAGGFVKWGNALKEMLNSGDWNRMANYSNDYFIVLDDIMAESSGDSKLRTLSAGKIFDILNDRHERRWTIITANCSLDTIRNRFCSRVASRLIRDSSIVMELPENTQDYAMR